MTIHIKRELTKYLDCIKLAVYKSNITRDKQIKRYFSTHDVTKLQIGCGPNRIPDWLNTDISLKACKEGAMYLDAGKVFPLLDNTIDCIYSEHLFEHLTHEQAVNMLQESYRVLKPGGTIRIATPDFKMLADLYLHPDNPTNKRYIQWSANGGGGIHVPETAIHVINKFHTAWGHQIIYDQETLSALLKDNGFHNVRLSEIGKSDIPAFNDVERHFNIIPFEFYQMETMILEADKPM